MGYDDNTLTAFDFFCGGGGASLGLHRAGINMLAALNHSPVAIATHSANFPGARHMLCDIRVQKSWGLGHADIMWASPDCTHHSIAKGGQSRDAKERALAEELPRFAYNLNVNCIMVENVKEFLDWGPLEIKRDQRGRPVLDKKGEEQWVAIKSRKKEYYNHWVETLAALGYVNYEYRLLNSADFGAPQSRVRYFGIFTRKGVAIEWPTPTHDKHGKHERTKWVAVRGVLDLEDKGRSIFTEWDQGPGRKPGDRPADKTLRRILAGLRKHVIGAGGREFLDKRSSNPASGRPGTGASTQHPGPTVATCYLPDLVTPAFIYKNQSNPPSGKPAVGASIDRPSDVITASWHPGLVSPQFLCNPAWGGASRSVDHCAPVVVARQDKTPLGMVSARFMTKAYGGDPRYQSLSLDDTAGAITCADHHQLNTAYMMHMNGDTMRSRAMCQPSTTITTSGGRQYMCTPQYLTHYYSGRGQHSSVQAPHPALTTQPHGRVCTPVFLQQYNGGSDNCRVLSLDGVSNTVPTENRFGMVQAEFLCGQYGQHHNTPLAQPCPPILTTPKQNVVTAEFLTQSNGVSEGVSPAAKTWPVDGASRTVLAGPNQALVQCMLQANGTRDHDDAARLTIPLDGQAPTLNTNGGNLYLMSYYGHGSTRPVCKPCPTLSTHDRFALLGFVTSSGYNQRAYSWSRPATPIVASRRHQYLILARPGSPVAVQPGDSVTMRLLKAVCRKHGIADIYMRMLKVGELKEIMGFPSDYYLAGSATKQKEMLGNAVVPQVSEAIARAMTASLQAARLRKLPKLRVQAINRYEQGSMFEKQVAP